MTKMKLMLNAVAVLAVCLILTTLAQAQATRTWVSGVGDDVNPCSRTAPCKTFAGAISKTAAGGEIDALDPAGYGALTITKAITVDGGTGSGWASVLASGTNGFIVNAGVNDRVILRHISINGTNQSTSHGLNAIRYLAGKQLSVEECFIFGFDTTGIDIAVGAGRNLYVKNTDFTGIAGTAIAFSTPSGGNNIANIESVRIEGCGNGLTATSSNFVTIRNSSFFQNTTNGISSTSAALVVETCLIAHNSVGVNVTPGSDVLLSNNSIFRNTTGISAGGTVRGFFNNKVFGNGTDGAVNAQTVQQ